MSSTLKSIAGITVGVLFILLCLGVMTASIVLGALNQTRCPVESYIPIYLIVLGAVSVSSILLTCCKSCCDDGFCSTVAWAFVNILNMFMGCWFIAGSYWIYRVYPPSSLPDTDQYCHQIMYNFAFGLTTVQWVMFGLVCLCGGCLTCLTSSGKLTSLSNNFYGATSFQANV
ncbi:transmembrane protein 272-like [Thalassophryne amazonica]|uniref:transmembrane protein 272-like n=1 Tax=Thalassophryne amazonica TaxID=390379 RepID=UPI001471FC26|nr:transmembrane protein 272-like [Thalassophryne amazonica]